MPPNQTPNDAHCTTPARAASAALAGFDDDALASILGEALSRGGDHADLFFEVRRTSIVQVEDDIVRSATAGRIAGVGVRVLAGERTGFAFTESRTPAFVRDAARAAATIASGGGGPTSVHVGGAAAVHDLYDVDPSLALAPSERVPLLRRVVAAARDVDPRVERVYAMIHEELRDIAVVGSDGTRVTDVQPMLVLRSGCSARDGDVRTTGSSGEGARRGLGLVAGDVPERVGRMAAEQAIRNLAARAAPSGPQTVVLAPAYSGILLHEAVGHGLEADFNRTGISRYSGQVGERVASPLVTVVDDGTMPGERGTVNVDDEGVPTGRTVLIEEGILRGYLHDRLSARLMDTAPTGSGRRQSFRHRPMPRMTNTLMPAGAHDPDEILGSVKHGVYAAAFGGGQVEIGKGDFVFATTEAYLIEDGRITAPLRDVTLIGNGPDVMSRVSMVGTDYRTSEGMWTCGKEGQSVPVGVGMPTVRVDDLTVGGTG